MTTTGDLELRRYDLKAGDRVDVQLLTVGAPGAPATIRGAAVMTATEKVLCILDRSDKVRIPWAAIATIRTNAAPAHPAQ